MSYEYRECYEYGMCDVMELNGVQRSVNGCLNAVWITSEYCECVCMWDVGCAMWYVVCGSSDFA